MRAQAPCSGTQRHQHHLFESPQLECLTSTSQILTEEPCSRGASGGRTTSALVLRCICQLGGAYDVLNPPRSPRRPDPRNDECSNLSHGPENYELETARVPSPGPGEALIKVEAVGICASDLKCYPMEATKFWGGHPASVGRDGGDPWT